MQNSNAVVKKIYCIVINGKIQEKLDFDSMELANEVLCAYAKADFRLAKALNVFQFLIYKAPTVEERKHGYWIEHPEHPICDCSVCGERVPIYSGSKKYKICPYCGAKMDGDNNGK